MRMVSAERAERHRQRGQAVGREHLAKGLRVRIEDRDAAEHRDARHQDQQAEPERGQRQAGEADDAERVIELGALIDRAEHAEGNADRGGEQQRQRGEPRGDRNARQDLLQRRLLRDVGIAEVAVQQAVDPFQVLDHQRLVDAELAFQIGLVGGIDEARRIEQDVDDIAGHDAQQEEDDDRDPDQGQDHQEQPAHDIAEHVALLPVGRLSLSGGGLICPSTRPRNDSRYRSCSSSPLCS